MNRAEMVEQAAAAWWEQAGSGQDWPALHENDPEAQWTRKAMAVVVDRIMPQVSTVAEMEALPDGAVVVGSDSQPWQKLRLMLNRTDWGAWGCTDESSSEWLLENCAPLTVVWRP